MSYSKNKITVHNSLLEAAEANEKYSAKQNPVDRIKETVQLILRVYALSPKKTKTNIIYIDI